MKKDTEPHLINEIWLFGELEREHEIFKQEFIKKEPDKKRMLDALVCLGSIANNLIRLNQDKGWVR